MTDTIEYYGGTYPEIEDTYEQAFEEDYELDYADEYHELYMLGEIE